MRSWLPCALLFALSALFLAPALGGSGFWWTDETRHAMGGVFILDLLRDLPLDDPMGYALRYFAQYPALALNWYLPGFYFVEAGFFALFGVSETVAHWTVFAFGPTEVTADDHGLRGRIGDEVFDFRLPD